MHVWVVYFTRVRVLIFVSAFVLAGIFAACEAANKLRSTKIKELFDHPRDYENREITIYGTVTGSASLFVVKFFEIQDETGTIKVVTERVLPKEGEILLVTGSMRAIEIGTERLIVLREKNN
jgi:aspartyl/asparaginyl-tRNA synthetase